MTNVQRFFARIGMDTETPATPDLELLTKIQSACVTSIAYENLDILEGRPLDLSPEALFDKIVTRGRGGYCFELNGLLTHMLREIGYSVTERFARYLRGEKDIPMRRHRVTVVSLPEGDYMCDIGVGEVAPRLPLKIERGLVQHQNGETYKFERDDRHGWVLWDQYRGQWREYICFSDDEALNVDFVQPSFYCEKHPDSIFNKEPMLAIKTLDGRRTLDGRVYKEFCGTELKHIEENISDARMDELLCSAFRLTPQ